MVDHLPQPIGNTLTNVMFCFVLFFSLTRAQLYFIFNFVSTKTTSFFSAKWLYSWVFLAHASAWSCPPKILQFLLNFMRCLSAHFSILLRTLWMAVWPSDQSDSPFRFVSWVNLSKVHSTPSSRSLLKMLSKARSSIDLWRTQLDKT